MTTQEIEENIRENIYRVLKKLVEGFFQRPNNRLNLKDPEVRLTVQDSTMKLLLRLLFLLYAEGKGCLSLQNDKYLRQYSFHRLRCEIVDKKYRKVSSTTLWSKLKDLFRLINNGSESIGISKKIFYIHPYFGWLFDPERNPNLETWEIGDFYLSDAIDYISRNWDKNIQKYVFIDYSFLNIRFLGSIYESLLGYKIKIAKQNMVLKGKTNKIWEPFNEFNKARKIKSNLDQLDAFDRVRAGEIYLAKEREDRKSLGSFYTPDNIVNIIIKNTLEPMVQEKLIKAKKNDQKLVDAILSIKVLDNAMGTGCFLLETVEYLAVKLYQALQEDIKSRKISKTSFHTINWAKEEVIFHCIYGVDLNDLAVELSKMALWLIAENKKTTLNILNNRIKQGNTLIGAFLDELDIYTSSNQDKEKKIDFDVLKIIADIRTSIYYGNPIQKEQYKKLISEILHYSEEELLKLNERDFIRRSRDISEKKLFFHWEMEFPEIFFNEKGEFHKKSGFDVILGNPPWVSIRGKYSTQIFTDYDISYLENKFPGNTYMPNTYEYFILQSLKLLKKGGRHSYIVPDRLGFNESVEYLRKIILNQYSLNSLLYKIPFPNVLVDTLIYSLTATIPIYNHKIIVKEYNNETVEIDLNFYQNISDTIFHSFSNKEVFDSIKAIDKAEIIKLENSAETTGGFGGKSELITNTRINNRQIEAVKGINVERYTIKGKRYFEFKKENITGRTTDKVKLGISPKILLRKTGLVLYSAYDDTGIYPEQSLYFLFNFKGGYSPLYLLSIINSYLFKFYYIEKLITNRETTPQLKKIHLDQFPIKKINFTTNETEKKNLCKILVELYDTYLQMGVMSVFEKVVNICLAKNDKVDNINEKNDVIHDFLTVLAQNMIDFNKKNSNVDNLKDKIHLTDKLIDFFIFKLYKLNSDNIKAIKKALTVRGI